MSVSVGNPVSGLTGPEGSGSGSGVGVGEGVGDGEGFGEDDGDGVGEGVGEGETVGVSVITTLSGSSDGSFSLLPHVASVIITKSAIITGGPNRFIYGTTFFIFCMTFFISSIG